jgi:hypothetical protein
LAADLEAASLCARSVSFHEDYLLPDSTPERMAETLIKLEWEVLGREVRTPIGKRRAVIRIEPPLDVGDFMARETAGASREETIEAIVIRLHEVLQGALDAIAREDPESAGGAGC